MEASGLEWSRGERPPFEPLLREGRRGYGEEGPPDQRLDTGAHGAILCSDEPDEGIGDLSGWWLASYLALWVLVGVLALVILALIRQVGALHLRLGPRGALEIDEEGPPLGEAPPPIEARDLDGRPLVIGGPGQRQFLLFVSPECPVCREVVPALPVVGRQMAAYLVSDGEARATADAYGGTRGATGVVVAPQATREYAVPGTPFAVILDQSGATLAKGTVNNLEQVEGLLDTARDRALSGAGHS